MRKLLLLNLIAILLSSPLTTVEISTNDVEDMIDIVVNNDLEIDEWEVTIKEKVNMNKKQDIIEEIKINDEYTRKENENSVLYTFEDSHNYSETVEIYNVLVPKNKSDDIEIVAVFKGYTWNEETKTNYTKWLRAMMNNVFTKSARKYTCLTTEFSGIINADYVLNYINEKLDIEHKQTQIDKNKNSTLDKVIYGYTPLWSQEVSIMDEPTNVQIAVITNEMGLTKFSIGTPILINEY
ncbi:YwmB family TATA-box binding protein [Virgibacillus sp. MSJ-26]|uniref:YwmB family TATA-box binding protein n=1 Tax=Virgibacillus sp. MSJ-26 TaxID=2841522 RepID=UPI001C1124F2|nr:YwmB family TATA-box binding protein [Virgibacillus sp. MSJ-26]